MNKYKKIATAVVAIVMAGTMVASLAACNPDNGPTGGGGTGKDEYGGVTDIKALPDKYDVVDANGNINYNAYKGRNKVTITTSVGHNNVATSISYRTALGRTITMPDGKEYSNNSIKPAWVQMGEDLNIEWNDQYTEKATNQNLTTLTGTPGKWEAVDLVTTDLSVAVSEAANTSILNLAEYMDYMPHFRAFLNQNPIVYLSLLQDGMNTKTGANRILYVAPYFDGNDDIERYCIIRQDWAAKLLNGDDELTNATGVYKTACATTTSATSYMQKTGKLGITSLNADGTDTITINKNYDAVVTAVKGTGALADAYKAITDNVAYDGTSGNIVDIMNAALEVNNEATGAQLTKLFRAYIDVCYEGHYTAANRANLFNGYDACWDVDDLVAMLRCVKTSGTELEANGIIYGIAPRSGQQDRTPDYVRLAAQLYGVRGADSRFENTYIDNEGKLQDARNDVEFYEAMASLNTLAQEGLVRTFTAYGSAGLGQGISFDGNNVKEAAFMMYDYNQTQTKNNFYCQAGITGGKDYYKTSGYNFAPIITPVAKWDVDGDGDHTDVMRFTESWRSTKTGGLAVNGNVKNNPDKLKAVLQFIDYLYSEDGQIVSTYGPMATDTNHENGYWYGNKLANQNETDSSKYFTYKGTKYSGYTYKKTQHPIITDNVKDSFYGKNVNGFSVTEFNSDNNLKNTALSFTDYARKFVGSTLPVGVKDQAFEDQCTSENGKTGSGKVAVALAEGVIKGMTLKMYDKNSTENDYDSWWYTCVPTGLPITSNRLTTMAGSDHKYLRGITGEMQTSGDDKKNYISIMVYIIMNGAKGTYNEQQISYTFAKENPVETLTNYLKDDKEGQVRENYSAAGWKQAQDYWTFLSSTSKK